MKREDKALYKDWIRALADYQGGRPHFSDQTPESLDVLASLVEIYHPTVIVELGTAHGLSTRLWIRETPPETRIHCVDAGFGPLRGAATVLPIDLERITLHEGWVRNFHLQDWWTEQDRVFLYIDVHSDHEHALPAIADLPRSSIVIFDDIWYSPDDLSDDAIRSAFVEDKVKPQIDYTAPKEIWPLSWAPYWKGGSFYGFTEVVLLSKWLADHKIAAHWEKGAKVLWWEV